MTDNDVRKILEDVVDYDGSSVQKAIDMLRASDPADGAVAAVIAALKDRRLAEPAAAILKGMGTDVLPQLIEACRGATKNYRSWIRALLRDLGGACIVNLRGNLQSDDAEIRALVARALSELGAGAVEAVPDLLARLGDPAPSVRSAVATALGAIGGPAEPALLDALRSSDPLVRSGAADALGSPWEAGGEAGLARIVPLAAASADADPRVRVEAVRSLQRLLGQIGEDCLHGCLQSSDPAVRIKALQSMSRIDRRADGEILQAMLDDSDAIVRRSTAAAFLRLRDYSTDKCLGILIEGLLDPADPARIAYAETLGGMRHRARRAVPVLAERALRDEDDGLRSAAITALGHIGPGDPDIVTVLIAAMDDVDYGIRENAMRAIAKFGPQADPAVSLIADRGAKSPPWPSERSVRKPP